MRIFPIDRAVMTGAGNSVTLRLMKASYEQNSVNTFRIRTIVIVGYKYKKDDIRPLIGFHGSVQQRQHTCSQYRSAYTSVSHAPHFTFYYELFTHLSPRANGRCKMSN